MLLNLTFNLVGHKLYIFLNEGSHEVCKVKNHHPMSVDIFK